MKSSYSSALHRGKWSAMQPARFSPGEERPPQRLQSFMVFDRSSFQTVS